MATYNGEKYIKEQIDSILYQLSDNDEIIISDDGSSDKTIEILRSYCDNRIRLYQNKKNLKGIIQNVENALRQVNGEYIFLCDQDDVWLPEKVRIIMSELKTADLVYTNAWIVDEALSVQRLLYVKPHLGFFSNLIVNNFAGATMAFRKQLLVKALPFPARIPMHDQWLGLLATLYGKTAFITEPMILYRRHSSNATGTGEKSEFGFIQQLKWRINIVFALLSHFFNK